MSTIKEMLQRVTRAKEGIQPQMPRIIDALKEEILDLNREGQLSLGLSSEGKLIGTYSRATEMITTQQALSGHDVRIKREGDPFDFLQTGDFFKEFTLHFGDNGIEIFSTDWKAGDLEARYPHLYGLTKENQHTLNYELIKPELVKFIKGLLHGTTV